MTSPALRLLLSTLLVAGAVALALSETARGEAWTPSNAVGDTIRTDTMTVDSLLGDSAWADSARRDAPRGGPDTMRSVSPDPSSAGLAPRTDSTAGRAPDTARGTSAAPESTRTTDAEAGEAERISPPKTESPSDSAAVAAQTPPGFAGRLVAWGWRPWTLLGGVGLLVMAGGALWWRRMRLGTGRVDSPRSAPGVRYRLRVGIAQDRGAREEQQDAVLYSAPHAGGDHPSVGMLILVADGMGGLSEGADASRTATRRFRSVYEEHARDSDSPHALYQALHAAHAAVQSLTNGDPDRVGTTLVAAAIRRRTLYWVSVGDSRLYLLRDGELAQLTADHSYQREYALAVARGTEAAHGEGAAVGRNVITGFLGMNSPLPVDRNVRPLSLCDGDILLLCSDGLYESLRPSDVIDMLPRSNPQQGADGLVDRVLAEQRASQDNLTAVVVHYHARPESAPLSPSTG